MGLVGRDHPSGRIAYADAGSVAASFQLQGLEQAPHIWTSDAKKGTVPRESVFAHVTMTSKYSSVGPARGTVPSRAQIVKTTTLALATGTCAGLLALAAPLRAQGADTLPGRLGMVTLHCRGNQDLSDIDWLSRAVSRGTEVYFVRKPGQGRALVSSFGPGPAWLGYPAMVGIKPGETVSDVDLRARARYAAASAVAVTTVLIVAGCAAVAPLSLAVLFALAAALSFGGIPTLAQGLWQQTAELPFLAGALAAALWTRQYPRLLSVVTFCAALALWLRPADAPLLLAIATLGVVQSMRAAQSLWTVSVALATALFAILPVAIWNLWYFDTLFSVAQWSVNQRITEHVFSISPRRIALGLSGLVISPGRGILWFAPLVPAVLGFSATKAIRRNSPGALILGTGIVGQWLLSGMFFKWWGGAGFGPRLMAETVWVAAAIAALVASRLSYTGRISLQIACVIGAVVGIGGLFHFDITAVELEFDRIHRPESYFALRAGPWTSIFSGAPKPIIDAPPGPFRYCAPQSLVRAR